MCFPKVKTPAAPEPMAERQAAKAPSDSALLQNGVERNKRRLGYANMQFTPVAGLAPAVTAGKTLLGM